MAIRWHFIGVLALALCLCRCGSYDVTLERSLSSDGQFWAELAVNRGSVVAGGDWYAVVLGKTNPTLIDTLTRNRAAAVCSLQGPGELTMAWADPRHLAVTCTHCRVGALVMWKDAWQGVAVHYVFK